MSTRSLPVALVALIVVVGCTRPQEVAGPTSDAPLPAPADASTSVPVTSVPPADPSTSVAAGSTAPPTTEAPTTTSTTAPTTTTTSPASPTTTAATTTIAPPTDPSDLVLIFDGILPARFGDRDVDVIATLAPVLGEPTVDAVTEYPVAAGGSFLNDADESFVAPFGRQVCWSNGLCTQFGAGAPETLIFTGWRLEGAGLATRDGITVGARWADHLDEITVDPFNSCFSVAYAAADGIDVELQSSDGPFAAPNDDGEFVAGDPDPAAVTVRSLSAGELPFFVFADC